MNEKMTIKKQNEELVNIVKSILEKEFLHGGIVFIKKDEISERYLPLDVRITNENDLVLRVYNPSAYNILITEIKLQNLKDYEVEGKE